MGRYYNPPKDLKDGKVGRRLPIQYPQTYAAAMEQIKEGEHLYVLVDRGIFYNAAYIPHDREFAEFYDQYARGMLLSFEMFALNDDEHVRTGW